MVDAACNFEAKPAGKEKSLETLKKFITSPNDIDKVMADMEGYFRLRMESITQQPFSFLPNSQKSISPNPALTPAHTPVHAISEI
ncbi:hypothetical protein O9G_004100 [Rozella allomycis CSF55]|uniref:Uncharacterized protein n=1 Tax=Rozella allomycis (strain CSF55) TaxID=988480 RepID=A0A075AWA5_ROZAC|nr:hypothetical protein O9G_004100 [Rozella allomycis CSF55]|eukprot:EPZ32829.1 hypothetical protein O9G_004100 [Rozella allomycis CSF55]